MVYIVTNHLGLLRSKEKAGSYCANISDTLKLAVVIVGEQVHTDTTNIYKVLLLVFKESSCKETGYR